MRWRVVRLLLSPSVIPNNLSLPISSTVSRHVTNPLLPPSLCPRHLSVPIQASRVQSFAARSRIGASESISTEDSDPHRNSATSPPARDKRPLSAYFRFANDMRPKLKVEFPDYKVTEVAKVMGERWRSLSDAEKQPYVDAYLAEKAAYEERNPKPKKK